jgi:hypothetical protein
VLAEIGIGPDEIDAARDRTVPAGLAGWPAM